MNIHNYHASALNHDFNHPSDLEETCAETESLQISDDVWNSVQVFSLIQVSSLIHFLSNATVRKHDVNVGVRFLEQPLQFRALQEMACLMFWAYRSR